MLSRTEPRPAPRHVVVVGASLAGLRTAEALRQAGFDGALTLVGREAHRPYNRPPLTKNALVAGPDLAALALPRAVELDATWLLGVSAVDLDVIGRRVLLDTNEHLAYDGLVIATGAEPRRLPSDVASAASHHIRTLEDASALHRALAKAPRRVLVIGAGFLGSEVASTAASLGHRVTLVEATPGPMSAALGPELSAYCARLHRSRGVDLHTSTTVRSLGSPEGASGASVAVLAREDGSRHSHVMADVVVSALGATPSTTWLQASGLDVEAGVATDDTLTALDSAGNAVSGVVAVGDVARAPQALLGGVRARIEHWTTAVEHSRRAAGTLLGQPASAEPILPSFWTDQHGVQIRGIGLPGAGDTTTIVDGALEDHHFVATRTRGGRLVGAVAANNAPALFRFRSELASVTSVPQPTP